MKGSSSRLKDRRILVTGATGGIGVALARSFVREGATLALIGRRLDALDDVCSSLGDGATAHAFAADVADGASVDEAIDAAADRLGGLDVVVNAAAIDTTWHPTGELPVEEWEAAIDVNLSGVFRVCRAVLAHLVASGNASIVNLTSVAGLRAWPLDAAYNASKAGVEMLTRTIAVEYAAQGVRANCLALGVIDAGMTDVVTDPVARLDMVTMHPIGRMGTVDEVAEAAIWLASDASSFTTGTTIVVDGGYLA